MTEFDEGAREILPIPSNEPIVITTGNYPGIYTIEPDKLNDTVYISETFEETNNIKIPKPYFRTGLLGD
jgi:hypothetical protein